MARNIYTRKNLWKQLLVLLALLIVAGSFWYSNIIVKRLADEERSKVTLWAQAVQRKARLIQYTDRLFNELAAEERKKVELWVDATYSVLLADEDFDINLAIKVIEYNTTIPIIQVNEAGDITGHRNVPGVIEPGDPAMDSLTGSEARAFNDSILAQELTSMKRDGRKLELNYYEDSYYYQYYSDSRLFKEIRLTFDEIQNGFIADVVNQMGTTPVLFVSAELDSVVAYTNIPDSLVALGETLVSTVDQMSQENEPIEVTLANDQSFTILYSESEVLQQLRYYPIIQFSVIGLFILIGYWLFSISRRSEQNQVWVGMSKETAHQLGTPLSSMIGWIELIRTRENMAEIAAELDKDVQRFEVITERFSKIGSQPELKPVRVIEPIENYFSYLGKRISSKTSLSIEGDTEVQAMINQSLFEWVIENLCKNAIDAMEGKGGRIDVSITRKDTKVYIDVADTGKGIPYRKRKTIFRPGYTEKKRGWGLGLSLAKRIIESYHQGKIFVKSGEPGKGTTFRIVLNAAD